MKNVTVQLSESQHAAIAALAKKLRMDPGAAVKVLAFASLSIDYNGWPEYRDILEETAEEVLDGDSFYVADPEVAEVLGVAPDPVPA